MQVVYAHTDSLYVPVPSIEKAQEVREILNTHIQENVFPNLMGLEDHPMDLEFEKYYSVLGVGATRNRNAGFINWKDGVHLQEPEFVCTGFTLKRIAESVIGKEVQKTALEMWINQKTEEDIISYVRDMYDKVRTGQVDKTDLIKRSRVKENRLKVKCPEFKCKKIYDVDYIRGLLSVLSSAVCEKESCNKKLKQCTTVEGKRPAFGGGFAGVLYYNEHVNKKDKLDDSFYHMKCNFKIGQPQTYTNWNGEEKKAGYIAVRNIEELKDYEPDWLFLSESEVLKKVKPIFDAMNWDISKVKEDGKQKTLDEWF
tara:strand:- start:8246 stop:9181 length:936 start_codon:yes stop_codon:yes gene_type:complete